MFDTLGPDALLNEIEDSQRHESMLIARRLGAIAALLHHRTGEAEGTPSTGPGYAFITGFARTSTEVAAALNLSSMTASRTVEHAEALDTRLPEVAALLAEGKIDWRIAAVVITRTGLVDSTLMARLDQTLADRIINWHSWSRRRVINAVDAAVRALDPEAAKERRVTADNARHISVIAQPNGMARIHGALPAPAAAVFDKRLSEMATSVCKHDTRTIAQRRADALSALSEGRALACNCEQADCPTRLTAESSDPRGVQIVINVIASQETVDGNSDQPGYLEGYGVIDADQVRQLAESAALRLLTEPAVDDAAALHYQPSAAVERWIRCRDLTCRFPGCDRSAWLGDIDHTEPFNHVNPEAGGRTIPANLKCYCREHHRLKTFHGGPGGWQDEQRPDGTIVWTSPTGRVYRGTPAGDDLFPQMRPACTEPTSRKRNRRREKSARIALARRKLAAVRPANTEQRRINSGRRQRVDLLQWRNEVRTKLLVLKGGQPSTSPWCGWVNDPPEDAQISADWVPPLPSAMPGHDDPPPF